MVRVLFLLQTFFSLWMLVDALQRRCACYWYLVVLIPFGEWVYFFAVKIHDPEFQPVRETLESLFKRRPSLEELRRRQEESPSFDNTLALARALYAKGRHQEAAGRFRQALKREESGQALHGLGLSLLKLKDYSRAAESFQRLIEIDPSYEDYDAYPSLARALFESGRGEKAIRLLYSLVDSNPRLNHRMLLAHYLIRAERCEEARRQLQTGLSEHRHAPAFLKKRQKAWARRAESMLRSVPA